MSKTHHSVFDQTPTMLLHAMLQVHGQQSFIESIGGEESPSTSDCIVLLAQYGLDSCGFCAVSSGATNGHQHLLHLHATTMHSMQHEHHTYPLWLDSAHIYLQPSQGSCDIPAILMPLV